MSSTVATPEPESASAAASSSTDWMESPLRLDVGELPEWYTQHQADSWHNFLETPAPVRTNEEWRFSDLKKIRFDRINPVSSFNEPSSLVDRSRTYRVSSSAAYYVFVNNETAHNKVHDLPEDVICLPINEALAKHSDLVKEYFAKNEAKLGGAKFAALNGASTLSGLFIYVPKNVVVEKPIEVHHYSSGDNAATFPHIIAVAEGNASVSIVEHFESIYEDDSPIAIGIVDLFAKDGGKIQYAAIQNGNPEAKNVIINTNVVGRDAQVKTCFVNLGCAWVRNESLSRMIDTGADSQMYSANIANSDEEYDQRTHQLHEAQHTTSNLLYKNALYDKARTIFAGLIRVGEGAHHTDSYQTCRNLLGSDAAEANSMPGLEIDADQVKCSHGSTSGQISDDEIFYLRARGIPAERARKMISVGFLNEVISKLDGEELRDLILEKVEAKFRVV